MARLFSDGGDRCYGVRTDERARSVHVRRCHAPPTSVLSRTRILEPLSRIARVGWRLPSPLPRRSEPGPMSLYATWTTGRHLSTAVTALLLGRIPAAPVGAGGGWPATARMGVGFAASLRALPRLTAVPARPITPTWRAPGGEAGLAMREDARMDPVRAAASCARWPLRHRFLVTDPRARRPRRRRGRRLHDEGFPRLAALVAARGRRGR